MWALGSSHLRGLGRGGVIKDYTKRLLYTYISIQLMFFYITFFEILKFYYFNQVNSFYRTARKFLMKFKIY